MTLGPILGVYTLSILHPSIGLDVVNLNPIIIIVTFGITCLTIVIVILANKAKFKSKN